MTKKRPKHDWPAIFATQKESGLTISEFCSKHKISSSAFYLNKQRHSTGNNFVEAKVVRQISEKVTQATRPKQTITLITQAGELSFPESISSDFLVSVIKGLS
ncbi:IS66 family insertion sequence element accessory protein TnpA [Alkalimarinus alittae]|jgi:hypothetical protein|uniref:IS66 family insertion sequence element accessory protein TnpB n=1 Tax=Alkalimarinus alittae TaxID=2961619 RepID=A0ABY6MXE4_9ALTE|nr:IS66 family insertion sequence element accessory protein TnpB [Alkalimarinus alittae]UZE94493.1 IS66 family insertion sequence element accessory protein TnpB [Alkalimarinus alittae]